MVNYGSSDTVRAYGVSSTDVSDAHLLLIMNLVDDLLDRLTGNVLWHWEQFSEEYGDDRFFIMREETAIASFGRVMIDGVELFEYSKENLVENPTVSDGESANDYPDYWEKGNETSATLTWDSAFAKTGSRSLSILKTAESTAYWNSEEISVEEGIPYRITGWIKTSGVSGGNGAFLRITWKDSNSSVLSSSDSVAVTGTDDWDSSSVTAVAPVDAVYAEVRLVHDGSEGTAYFDRFFFSERYWIGDATNYTLELVKPLDGEVIQVRYTRTTVPEIVSALATKLYVRNALVAMAGGTTQGLSYRFADQQVSRDSLLRQRIALIEGLDREIKDLMREIDLRDLVDWNDFAIVENEFDFGVDTE